MSQPHLRALREWLSPCFVCCRAWGEAAWPRAFLRMETCVTPAADLLARLRVLLAQQWRALQGSRHLSARETRADQWR